MRDLAGRDLERGVEIDDAMPPVIVGMSPSTASSERERKWDKLGRVDLSDPPVAGTE
jgi:hypothetical protein